MNDRIVTVALYVMAVVAIFAWGAYVGVRCIR